MVVAVVVAIFAVVTIFVVDKLMLEFVVDETVGADVISDVVVVTTKTERLYQKIQ